MGIFGPPNIDKLKARKNINGLIEALMYEDEDVRWRAVEALGEIGKPAVEPLIGTLKDESSNVRSEAAWALVDTSKPAEALEPLNEACKESYVLVGTIDTLGKIGDKRAVEPLTKVLKNENLFVRGRATVALAMIGKPAVESLIEALKDEVVNVRWCAAKALVKIGKPAVKPLIEALQDKKSYVRSRSAKALGEIGDNRAVESLISALKDKDSDVREYAAEALKKIKAKKS